MLVRFRALGKRDRRIALDAAAGLIATWAGLRVFGFRRWQRALGWITPAAINEGGPGQTLEEARRIARMLAATERNLFFRANCLEHSLVMEWLLRSRGIASSMRIGGRKHGGRFEAHAWVEVGGVPVEESRGGHADFVPFEQPLPSLETQPR